MNTVAKSIVIYLVKIRYA